MLGEPIAFRLPRWFVALLVMGVIPFAAWADTMTDLQEKLERTQNAYDEQLRAYNLAKTNVADCEGQVQAAKITVQQTNRDRETALANLKKVQELSRGRPDISDDEENREYASAVKAHDEAVRSLDEKRARLARARGDVGREEQALQGLREELTNLKFRALQEALSQEKTVTGRGEAGCDKLTVEVCRRAALDRAKEDAIQKGSSTLIESESTIDDVFIMLGTDNRSRHKEEVASRIRSKVRGVLVGFDIVGQGWVGQTSYFYEIKAVVKGEISRKDFLEFMGIEDVEEDVAASRDRVRTDDTEIVQSARRPSIGYYLSLSGGVAIPADLEFVANRSGSGATETTVAAGVDWGLFGLQIGLGYAFGGIRPEVFLGYGIAPVTSFMYTKYRGRMDAEFLEAENRYWTSTNNALRNGALTVTIRSVEVAAKLYYDIFTGGALTPYVGIGGGGTSFQVVTEKGDTSDVLSDPPWTFAFHAAVGIGYAVSDTWTITGGYRLSGTLEGVPHERELTDAFIHNVEVGVRMTP